MGLGSGQRLKPAARTRAATAQTHRAGRWRVLWQRLPGLRVDNVLERAHGLGGGGEAPAGRVHAAARQRNLDSKLEAVMSAKTIEQAYDLGFSDAMEATKLLVRRAATAEDALIEHDRDAAIHMGRYKRSARKGWLLFMLSLCLNFWLIAYLLLRR